MFFTLMSKNLCEGGAPTFLPNRARSGLNPTLPPKRHKLKKQTKHWTACAALAKVNPKKLYKRVIKMQNMFTIYSLFGSFKLVILHYCWSAARGRCWFFLQRCTSSELTLPLAEGSKRIPNFLNLRTTKNFCPNPELSLRHWSTICHFGDFVTCKTV